MFGLKRERTLCVGVVGLGLIGGSMAKALKKYTGHLVYGCDIDRGDPFGGARGRRDRRGRRGKTTCRCATWSFSPSTRSRRSPS